MEKVIVKKVVRRKYIGTILNEIVGSEREALEFIANDMSSVDYEGLEFIPTEMSLRTKDGLYPFVSYQIIFRDIIDRFVTEGDAFNFEAEFGRETMERSLT